METADNVRLRDTLEEILLNKRQMLHAIVPNTA